MDRGTRLGAIWIVYRGDAHAVATYTLRAYAGDGILVDTADIIVTIR